MVGCIGCDLSEGRLQSIKVYEDDLVKALMDIDPINNGHVLLITREHRLDLDELTDAESIRIMQVSKLILRALREVYDFDGYSIMQNGGVFNEITHYHYHVFPRYEGDGFDWSFGVNNPNDINEEGPKIRAVVNRLKEDESK